MATRVPIVTYHAIVGGDLPNVLPEGASSLHVVRADDFRAHLDWLRRRGWQTVLPQRLGEPLPDRAVVITLDDGYQCHRFAADELMGRGFRSAFYVTWSTLGQRGYLSHSEVGELYGHGFEIGSHALTHAPLTRLSDGELARELNESKQRLENLVGGPVDGIAVPYGAYDRRVLAAATAAGYARVMTSDAGLARVGCVGVLPRLTIGASTTLAVFERRLIAGQIATFRRRIVHGVARRVRRLSGASPQ